MNAEFLLFSFVMSFLTNKNPFQVNQVVQVNEETLMIDNITFVFTKNLPCSNIGAVGCVLFYPNPNPCYYSIYEPDVTIGLINRTVYMTTGPYDGYKGLNHLCNHELCHMYLTVDESVCRGVPITYKQCDDLVSFLRGGNN